VQEADAPLQSDDLKTIATAAWIVVAGVLVGLAASVALLWDRLTGLRN
jgi:hypothetical protein